MISGTETVTIVRVLGKDAYGDPIPGTPTRIDITDCLVAARTSIEPTERGREGVVTGWQVIAPDGATALYTDGIELFGGGTVVATQLPVTPATAIVCRIEGEIAAWPPMGVIINAVRAVG